MRCNLKNEKEPVLGRGTGSAGGRKGYPRQRQRHMQRYPHPQTFCQIVAENLPFENHVVLFYKTYPNGEYSEHISVHKEGHFLKLLFSNRNKFRGVCKDKIEKFRVSFPLNLNIVSCPLPQPQLMTALTFGYPMCNWSCWSCAIPLISCRSDHCDT